MLRLKNIMISGTQICANYFPEDLAEKGYVGIDIISGEIIDCITTTYDNPFNAYLSHAAQALIKMIELDVLPTEKVIMWY